MKKLTTKYSKIDRRMHGDEKYRQLSRPQPNGQSLWEYLLTGPHNTQVPGVFVLGEAAMAEAMEWSLDDTRRCFAEILTLGMARFDRATRLVWLPNALKHNQPESPNVVISWRAVLPELPECALREEIYGDLRAAMAERGKAFGKAFTIALGEAPPHPSPNPSGKGRIGARVAAPSARSGASSEARAEKAVSAQPSEAFTKGFGKALTKPSTKPSAIQEHEQEQIERGDAHAHTHARETDPPPPPPAVADPSPEVPPTGSWGGLPEVSCATVERPNELVADSILDALLRASDGRVDIRGPAQTTAAFVRAVREARYTLAEIATLGRYVAAGECAWARRTRFDLGFFIATDRNGVIRLSELVTKAIEWNAERTAPRPAPAPVLRVVPSARVLSSEERVSGFAAARRMLEARGAAALSAGEPTTEEHRDG